MTERQRCEATARTIERNARAFDRAGHHRAAAVARGLAEAARARAEAVGK